MRMLLLSFAVSFIIRFYYKFFIYLIHPLIAGKILDYYVILVQGKIMIKINLKAFAKVI